MPLRTVTLLGHHHHCPCPALLHLPKSNLCPHKPFAFRCPSPGAPIPPPVSADLIVVGVSASCKWEPAGLVRSRLPISLGRVSSRLWYVSELHSSVWTNHIPSCGWSIDGWTDPWPCECECAGYRLSNTQTNKSGCVVSFPSPLGSPGGGVFGLGWGRGAWGTLHCWVTACRDRQTQSS